MTTDYLKKLRKAEKIIHEIDYLGGVIETGPREQNEVTLLDTVYVTDEVKEAYKKSLTQRIEVLQKEFDAL